MFRGVARSRCPSFCSKAHCRPKRTFLSVEACVWGDNAPAFEKKGVSPMKALIPAAGLGTRFLPATKAQPKEMLLVVDRPAIQYVVEEGLASAADEVVIINSREKKAIEDHF